MGILKRLEQAIVDPQIAAAVDAASVGIHVNALGYDPWGYNPEWAKVYYSLARFVYRYFRPRIHGIESLPAGRALVVGNHSGQLPFDAIVVTVAALVEAPRPRLLRAMVERWVPRLPLVNIAFSRCGVALGDPINSRNLLEADNAVLVFPEGTRGSGKTWWHRYQLAPFGRGFMRLALQTNSPIVPVGIVGAEESIISVAEVRPLARLLQMPYLPVPALLPLLGPLAYVPLPTRFHVYFGEPMTFQGPFDDEDEAIEAKVREVAEAVEGLIARGRRERTSWFG